MHIRVALRILGSLLMMFSLTMLPPIIFSQVFEEGLGRIFFDAFTYTFVSGLILWLAFRHVQDELRTRDGFLVTFVFYLALGSFGAIPFIHPDGLNLGIPNGLFESFSGLTTTGATVVTNLDSLPKAILFYRQQLQWLGGMGIIVLAVAILPMLGIGGMQLFRTETPGPMKDSKLTPRIKQTALALWSIYVGLTLLCAIAYWIAGMGWFDAICHSFTTLAIGGFSTHDASIGYFDSQLIESIAIFFMVIAGMNFGLHFLAWRERSILHYLADEEVRFYLTLLGTATLAVSTLLFAYGTYDVSDAFRYGIFQVVSIFTTTGYVTTDFSIWPTLIPFLVFFGAFTGACAGSTGGGIKVIRALLLLKQGMREIQRLIHPNAVIPVKVNKRSMPDNIIEAVWGFFSIYVLIFIFMHLALMATDLDFVTSFSAVGAAINNLGPGLGTVALHYGDISPVAKIILCFAMMLGRLEIFTLLVLFSPSFWRR